MSPSGTGLAPKSVRNLPLCEFVSDTLGHSSMSVTDAFYRHAITAMQEESAGKVAGLIFSAARLEANTRP